MTPKEVADNRFARGEITIEEHRRILEQLAPDSTINRKFATQAGTVAAPTAAAPAAPGLPSSSGLLFKIAASVATFAFVTGLGVMYLRNKDMNEARLMCDSSPVVSASVDCSCYESSLRSQFSFAWYIPVVRGMLRPEAAEIERLMVGAMRQCRR